MRYTTFAYDLTSVQLAVSRPISDRPFFRHYYGLQHRLRSNPHLGTYVRHFRLADDPEDPEDTSWIAYEETPIKPDA